MIQRNFEAKVVPGVGGAPIVVSVSANNMIQAKKMIAAQYAPQAWCSVVRQRP